MPLAEGNSLGNDGVVLTPFTDLRPIFQHRKRRLTVGNAASLSTFLRPRPW